MRIEIDDPFSYRHQIDTGDAALVAWWFAEKAAMLMSANVSLGECRLRIWPVTHEEFSLIGQREIHLTQEALQALAGELLAASMKLADQ